MDDHEADSSDDHLMARVVRRDRAAFGTLTARHLGSVHRYLTRMTSNHADADDLTQETFLRVWLNAASYRPGTARLTTWLHRIAHNLAVDELRKRRTVQFAEPGGTDADDELTGGSLAEAAADPAAHLEAARTQARLDEALTRLPPNQRAALLLRQVQGFSQEEAADVLGVSVSSLESLVGRARRALRAHLLTDAPEPQRRPT
jgi:RNA polymerase sigma-70 factor, ECF subfamily